jgi:hypothetical protein
MTDTTTISNETISAENLEDLLARLKGARLSAVSWITDRIADDGRPAGADVTNAWWRAPWALAVGGDSSAASALMGWIEREALTDEGDLRAGPFAADAPQSPVYKLSPIAIAAWLLARYSTAGAVMDRLEYWTDDASGGAYEYADFVSDSLSDNLKTCQLGIATLVTGRRDAADGVYRWLRGSWNAQPDLPNRLYSSWRDGKPVTEFDPSDAYDRVLDFSAARQAYFNPGISGAFLAGYGQQTGNADALRLGQDYLRLSQNGTDAQFNDSGSVQICKFGWGEAAMLAAAPESGQLPWVIKMGEWFIERQRPDGAWAPSVFHAPPVPGELDLFWKTTEHLMELAYIEQSLSAVVPAA